MLQLCQRCISSFREVKATEADIIRWMIGLTGSEEFLALKFVQMQSYRLFISIHSPTPPPAPPNADPIVHRLPTGRQIEDEDVNDIYWTGRSSGKTPSPPLLRLPSPHQPRSGNSSIMTLTAACQHRHFPHQRQVSSSGFWGRRVCGFWS